ncbi:hypothetical protein LCGC14_2371910 [marine sediment metagenome]|uniref:Uncharacterized protein n=1 Tax=marine sediment metagenome TaxID=412755 RepID=A0A0F9CQT5_9ZZZZ
MKLTQLLEARYVTRDYDRSMIKRIVKKLSNGKLVKNRSGPNTFYYDIPDIKIAFDNFSAQFGKTWAKGHHRGREGDLAYYMWIVSGWKVKLSVQDMKLEVWQAGDMSLQ